MEGAYTIWTAGVDGQPIGFDRSRPESEQSPNPTDPTAVDIYFGLRDRPVGPPREQVELQERISNFLHTLKQLYFREDPGSSGLLGVMTRSLERAARGQRTNTKLRESFRAYYGRVFRIAQLGLQGQNAATDVAEAALSVLESQLTDEAMPAVKNRRLVVLLGLAGVFSAPLLLGYVVLRTIAPDGGLAKFISKLGIGVESLSCFLLLWVGSFVGVWLAYGVRTTTPTLGDLTRPEADRIYPGMRMLFAGTLAMVAGIIATLGVIEVKIGDTVVTDIVSSPMLAFLFGVFCGLGELVLPSAIGKRASEFASKI